MIHHHGKLLRSKETEFLLRQGFIQVLLMSDRQHKKTQSSK